MTITLTREEAQQVLDALIKTNAEWKHLADSGDAGNWAAEDQDHYQQCDTAIETLRARLAQPDVPETAFGETEPVAWMHNFIDDVIIKNRPTDITCNAGRWTALYTAPPQREWQGLTEQDFSAINQSCSTKLQAATSAESILKEKNA